MGEYAVTEPGVYEIPEDAYHADPVPDGSLSVSGAKKLLQPGGPAVYRYEREHPRPSTAAMELGTAAHRLVLGTGREIAVVDAKDWRTRKAQDAADQARAAGRVPLLTADHDTVQAMAAALRGHPLAAALLAPHRGTAEASAFWVDPDYGIWRRLRWDFMPEPQAGWRTVIADYKTTADASPKGFAKSVANFGYHQQADWYTAGYLAMYGHVIADIPVFAFIAQEKTPPYLVAVYRLSPDALALGRDRNERAMEIYRDCTEAGTWPGYQPDPEIELLDLPNWAYREDY